MSKSFRNPAQQHGRMKLDDAPKRSFNSEQPKFSLKHLKGGKFCLSKCEQVEKAAFADKLRELSQMTWQELQQAPHHGMGFEKIRGYKDIPADVSPEINILAFRFCGMKAMIGYRIDETFYIIALDRNFTAYDHG